MNRKNFPRSLPAIVAQAGSLLFRRLAVGIAFACLCCILTGCHTVATPSDVLLGKGYQPQNVYTEKAALPKNIRRVAVLPLVCDESSSVMTEGRAALEPVLVNELIKTKKFEVVSTDGVLLSR